MQSAKLKQGFGLLEVLLGMAILSVSFFVLFGVAQSTLRVSRINGQSLTANFLLEEGIEALRSVRDDGWTANIAPLSGTRYLSFSTSSSKFTTTTTPEIINSLFYRSFTIDDVYRDTSTKDIMATGGILDENTKKFTINVGWRGGNATTTRSVSTYLTNYFND